MSFLSMRDFLKEAKPEWSATSQSAAASKLAKICVITVEELTLALKDGTLNAKLKDVGEKAFSRETLQAFSIVLDVEAGAQTAPTLESSLAASPDKAPAMLADDDAEVKDSPSRTPAEPLRDLVQALAESGSIAGDLKLSPPAHEQRAEVTAFSKFLEVSRRPPAEKTMQKLPASVTVTHARETPALAAPVKETEEVRKAREAQELEQRTQRLRKQAQGRQAQIRDLRQVLIAQGDYCNASLAYRHEKLLADRIETSEMRSATDSQETGQDRAIIMELRRVQAQKRAAIEAEDYLGAESIRKKEKELMATLDKLKVAGAAADDQWRLLEEQLEEIRNEKRRLTQEEDYVAAQQAKERESKKQAEINELVHDGTSFSDTANSWYARKLELAKVQAEKFASIMANDYDRVQVVSQRENELSASLEALGDTCDRSILKVLDEEFHQTGILDGRWKSADEINVIKGTLVNMMHGVSVPLKYEGPCRISMVIDGAECTADLEKDDLGEERLVWSDKDVWQRCLDSDPEGPEGKRSAANEKEDDGIEGWIEYFLEEIKGLCEDLDDVSKQQQLQASTSATPAAAATPALPKVEVAPADQADNEEALLQAWEAAAASAAVSTPGPGSNKKSGVAASVAEVETVVAEVRDAAKDQILLTQLAELTEIPQKIFKFSEPEVQVLERIDRFGKMTATLLQLECQGQGFAWDEFMSRTKLLDIAKKAFIYEKLDMPALYHVCGRHGLEVDLGHAPPAAELREWLASLSWEAEGVPISRLEGHAKAQQVYTEIMNLKSASPSDLQRKCRQLNLPYETKPGVSLEGLLRKECVWRNMPLDELRRECLHYGLSVGSPTGFNDYGNVPEHGLRQELLNKLTKNLRRPRKLQLDDRGIPSDKFHEMEQAEEVGKELDRLSNLSILSLKREYQKLGVTFSSKLDVDKHVANLREVLVWKHLPLAELQKECRKKGIQVNVASDRKQLLTRLQVRQQQLLKLEEDGIDISRFGDPQVALSLQKELSHIDRMSMSELTDWFTQAGCPSESNRTKHDLAVRLKRVTAWQAMPVDQLKLLCKEKGIRTESMVTNEKTNKLQDALVDALFERELMQSWEDQGFCANSIGDFSSATELVRTYEGWLKMKPADLRKAYKDVLLPEEEGLERSDMLQRLRQRLIWELLPISELRKELERRGLEPKGADSGKDEDHKMDWVMHLQIDKWRTSFEKRGIPVGKLGPERSAMLNAELDLYEGMSDEALREAYDKCLSQYLPLVAHASREDLIERLREWFLWVELPLPELRRECEQKGISLNGLEPPSAEGKVALSTPGMPDPMTAYRDTLVFLLLFRARVVAFEKNLYGWGSSPPTLSPDELTEGLIAPSEEVWRWISQMQDSFLARVICKVSPPEPPKQLSLPAAAKSWPSLEAAFYLLSNGKFNPQELWINASEVDESTLISVICPTRTASQAFHPNLYANFQKQLYEPKELVVVDTGPQASQFLQEKAQEDRRVVYQHFPVADFYEGMPAEERKNAWTLGMKRNFATYLARGTVIAQFDDDDIYSERYLSHMWDKVSEEAAHWKGEKPSSGLAPAFVKLSAWHLLDFASMSFHYLDIMAERKLPACERRDWLFGWGFSYVFTRAAWQMAPFPDLHFSEDMGFVEGLMSRMVPIGLVEQSEELQERGLVSHTLHEGSTTGNEFQGFMWRGVSIGKQVKPPKDFTTALVKLKYARPTAMVRPNNAMVRPQHYGSQAIGGRSVQNKLPPWQQKTGLPIANKLPVTGQWATGRGRGYPLNGGPGRGGPGGIGPGPLGPGRR